MRTIPPCLLVVSLLVASEIPSISADSPTMSDDTGVISIDKVPQAVREAILRMAGEQPITAITRETTDGVTVYRARIEQKGLDRRLTVNENGAVVSDRRFSGINEVLTKASDDASAAKEEAVESWTRIRGGGTGDPLSLDQLPAPAQSRIQTEAGPNRIGDIHGETFEGKTVYRARLVWPDGSERVIKVSEDGQLLQWKQRDRSAKTSRIEGSSPSKSLNDHPRENAAD